MSEPYVIEEWRPVVGWEGLYSVSSLGRVMRSAPGHCTYPGKLISFTYMHGYPQVKLLKHSQPSRYYVHRLVAAAFIGPLPDGHQVNHKNMDRLDARAINLEYVTRRQNFDHAITNGSYSKIMPDDVQVVIARASKGELHRLIAADFGVSRSCISRIVRGERRVR